MRCISERQREASRRNGALSRGPVTPQGKAVSRFNGFVHGLASHNACLAVENPEQYEALRAAVHARFTPTCDFERQLADEITAQTWQYRRADHLQSALLEHKMGEMEKDVDAGFQKIDTASRVALAFAELRREGDPLDLLDRYQSRRHSQRIRNIQLLRSLLAEPADEDPPCNPPTEPGGVELLSPQCLTLALAPAPEPEPDPPAAPEPATELPSTELPSTEVPATEVSPTEVSNV